MNKLNKKGFSTVEILIVLLVVIVIALGGWLVYKNNHKTKKTTATATSKTQTQTKNLGDANTVAKPSTKHFNGGFGVNWVSFDYPSDWMVTQGMAQYTDYSGITAGPSIIIKSPNYAIVKGGQDMSASGNYIELSSTHSWNSSLSYWKSIQGPADPNGTISDFTFAGKQASIFNASNAQDTTKKPALGLVDMYKGVNTWIQGNGIIYTFYGSTGVDAIDGSHPAGNPQELRDAIKVLLDSWKWQ